MLSERFDSIVIGSGAGGATAARALTRAGQRVLLLEKGLRLPRSAATLDPAAVIEQGRFKSTERWHDRHGRVIVPEEYFNVGGKTKWYGAALMRCAPREMEAEPAFDCRAWPLDAETFTPWFDLAAATLGARVFDCEPDLARLVATLARRGWADEPLPMGLAADITDHPDEARHFDGFASPSGRKCDAERIFLECDAGRPGPTLVTDATVAALLPAAHGPRIVDGVRLADGRCFRAARVLLAAGALHSPRLLARYLDDHDLDRLPIRRHVGRYLKLHHLTALVALSSHPQRDLLRKTTALRHADFPHSSAQPLGFDGDLLARLMPPWLPRSLARRLGARAYGLFLQTEDGSHPDNRVHEAPDGTPVLDYDAHRCPALHDEHTHFARRLARDLLLAGRVPVMRRIGLTGTAHACGTLTAGASAQDGVVDAQGRVHGMDGLYVVDGSALPRSTRVNPSLSIFAWSLKVAAGIADVARSAA